MRRLQTIKLTDRPKTGEGNLSKKRNVTAVSEHWKDSWERVAFIQQMSTKLQGLRENPSVSPQNGVRFPVFDSRGLGETFGKRSEYVIRHSPSRYFLKHITGACGLFTWVTDKKKMHSWAKEV